MATSLVSFRLGPVQAYSAAAKPDHNRRKPVSSTWWSPLFGWSSDPDYISSSSTAKTLHAPPEAEAVRPKLKFTPGPFTEEKAKKLRMKTAEGSTFHDIMYHSAIASRLATDLSPK